MQSVLAAWDRMRVILNSGIGGSAFTPLKLLTVLLLISALIWGTRRGTRWVVSRILARRGVDIGVREALATILRYVVITLGTLVILQSSGIDLTSLNVFVGAIGVGLGFGLQNIASNFFSGLIILFERPIRIGDRVEIGGAVGEVREIGARATTVVTDASVALIVPNSQFVSERVTNWSRPAKLTAYTLSFYVAHTSDPVLVRRVLLAAAAGYPGALREPAPGVEFVEAGLSALRFDLHVWSAEHVKTAGALKSDLNFEVWRQLGAAGVSIQPAALPLGVQLTKPSG
ncbi:MAG TPA: mechanosensitive ion channel domain-containing protein [Vicinamibacterales bacterium]|nr:mechanosensitive ion channel domain-containing protein [Vicinamibacterales bacterium]